MTLVARFGVARFGESYFGLVNLAPASFDDTVAVSLKSGGSVILKETNKVLSLKTMNGVNYIKG